MAKDLQKLIVRFEAENEKLHRQLNQSKKKLSRFEKRAKSSVGAVKKAFIALGSVGALVSLGKGVLSTAAAFEKMEASLKTVTGSAANANKAMKQIQAFTSSTPFQVEEVTQAFIKLKALGLKPSEESLRSYGNTASAMGKSLNQMIEAVADAATGEFERLKEFGIKARSQGDKVSLTFQGVTTTIGKNAEEIEGYLRGIGNVQFAGAMDEQMGTIDGKVSNLKDTIDRLFVALGEAGLTQAFKDSVQWMTKFITKIVESETAINTIVEPFLFIKKVIETVALTFVDIGDKIGAFAAQVASFFALDFDAMERIGQMRDEAAAAREAEFEAIWAGTDAINKQVEAEERLAAAKTKPGATGEQHNEALAKEQEFYEKKYEQLLVSQETELEAIQSKFDQQQAIIDAARAREIGNEVAWDQAEMRNVAQKEAAITEIENREADKREKRAKQEAATKRAVVAGLLGALAATMDASSKSEFEKIKKLKIAEAIINTYSAISQSLGAYPFPFNAIAAAAAGALGYMQVRNIKRQTWQSSSGTLPALATSAAAVPSTSAIAPPTPSGAALPGEADGAARKEPQTVYNISISGNPTGEQVRALVDTINEEQDNGVILNATVTA